MAHFTFSASGAQMMTVHLKVPKFFISTLVPENEVKPFESHVKNGTLFITQAD